MTIHELLQAAGLTANDEIPIWDADGTGEPTKKITAQQFAAAVVVLANLVTGVKGDAEASYRQGNVNITPANIGAKAVQSAVSDPTASGTAVAFIDSISQNAQGVISPTKKTVQSASQSAAGLMSAADKTKLDGIAAGAAVTSVNNQTGAVSITPANIGAVAKTGDTMTGSLTIKGSWPGYNLQPNNGSQTTVSFVASDTDGHGFFETRSLDGTKHEWYNLPNSTTNGGYYNILTDKSPVTISQGGTGATTPDGACDNLGAVKRYSTEIEFGGSESALEQNMATFIDSLPAGTTAFIRVNASANTDHFSQYTLYCGYVSNYFNGYGAGILSSHYGKQIIVINRDPNQAATFGRIVAT